MEYVSIGVDRKDRVRGMNHTKAVDGRQISKRGAARIKDEQRKDRQNRKRAARYRVQS